MFTPKTQLLEAVSNNDLLDIYSILTLIAHNDRSFSTGEFMDAVKYVKERNIPSFIKPFDGRKLESKEHWTEEYWEIVLSSLISNFSIERINHLKEVSAYLYPKLNKQSSSSQANVNNKPNNKPKPKTETKTEQTTSVNREPIFSKKIIPIAVTAGATLICIVALAIGSKKIAAAAWVGAVLAGAYTVLKKED